MSHRLELRTILSYLIFYNFRGTFILFLLGLLVLLFCFILLDLFVLDYLQPQTLVKWGIGKAMERGSIF